MSTILVAGSAHFDMMGQSLYRDDVIDCMGDVSIEVGGTGCNIAINLAQAGVKVRFLTAMNDSAFSSVIAKALTNNGVETHVEIVKSAMFTAGAGQIGDYECCAWQALGVGQFRPLAGATPFIGTIDTLEHIAEYKVEMVCAEAYLQDAVAALKQNHPYQEPAYDVIQMINI